jgi:hypothetical protein
MDGMYVTFMMIEMHTPEPLVPEPTCLKVEIVIEKLNRYKLPCMDQILSELIQEGANELCSDIHKLINSVWNKNCHSRGRILILYLFTKRVINYLH